MAIRLSITECKELGAGIWEAQLDPDDLRMLAPAGLSYAGPSVLLLTAEASLSPGGALEASLSVVRVLNVGNDRRVFVVRGDVSNGMGRETEPAGRHHRVGPSDRPQNTMGRRPGDVEFLNATPVYLRPLAQSLLTSVRREYAGELVFKRGSGRFVESPDNWWTVKPQPVARSFRFTVRMPVEKLEDLRLPNLARDRNNSYAAFTMDAQEQVGNVLAALRRVAQNRRV